LLLTSGNPQFMWLAMVNSFPSLDLELLDTLVLCSILYVFRIATCKYDL